MVCELDGPMPILKISNTLKLILLTFRNFNARSYAAPPDGGGRIGSRVDPNPARALSQIALKFREPHAT